MRCRLRPFISLWPWVLAAAALFAGLALPAGGQAVSPNCPVPASNVGMVGQSALRFGIYPGGPAGSVSPKAPPRPENRAKRLSALKTLAGSSPLVVRLYSAWTGDPRADDVGSWLDAEISGYTAAGLQVELVVRYKPAGVVAGSAPAAFANHVRTIVRRYGSDPRFVSLQVTNEANIPGAPEAADGAFARAAEALVNGVIAAKSEARQEGHGQVRVGFSWAYDERPLASTEFWETLGRLGGVAFADAVDWVGLDAYPGTWVPQIAVSELLPGLAGVAMKESVRSLRDCFMPLAGLGKSTSLQIAENGFPTGPGRSDAMQAQVLESMVRSVDEIRGRYGITDYRWFDLRDSSSADPNIESQYGITRDDYSPKSAFNTYRNLIGRHSGAPGAGSTPVSTKANCQRSPLKISVPRWKSRRLPSLVVHVGSKVVKRVRRAPRSVRISMRAGRSKVKLKLVATAKSGRSQTRVHRRTYRIC